MLVPAAADLPAALSHLENAAAAEGIEQFDLEMAFDAHTAVAWVVERGHRIFPFYGALLSSSAFIPRDRYLPFGPALFF